MSKPSVPSLLFNWAVMVCTFSMVWSTLAIVAATSTAARLAVSCCTLSSVPSAFVIIAGTCRFSPASNWLSCWVEVVRPEVTSRTLWSDWAMAGSANSVLRLAMIESSLGNMRSTAGTISANFPIAPPLTAPVMVSPGCRNPAALSPRIRFIFTFPIISLSISAVLPRGIERALSTSKRTTAPPLVA